VGQRRIPSRGFIPASDISVSDEYVRGTCRAPPTRPGRTPAFCGGGTGRSTRSHARTGRVWGSFDLRGTLRGFNPAGSRLAGEPRRSTSRIAPCGAPRCIVRVGVTAPWPFTVAALRALDRPPGSCRLASCSPAHNHRLSTWTFEDLAVTGAEWEIPFSRPLRLHGLPATFPVLTGKWETTSCVPCDRVAAFPVARIDVRPTYLSWGCPKIAPPSASPVESTPRSGDRIVRDGVASSLARSARPCSALAAGTASAVCSSAGCRHVASGADHGVQHVSVHRSVGSRRPPGDFPALLSCPSKLFSLLTATRTSRARANPHTGTTDRSRSCPPPPLARCQATAFACATACARAATFATTTTLRVSPTPLDDGSPRSLVGPRHRSDRCRPPRSPRTLPSRPFPRAARERFRARHAAAGPSDCRSNRNSSPSRPLSRSGRSGASRPSSITRAVPLHTRFRAAGPVLPWACR
jgi:hypothetical protein